VLGFEQGLELAGVENGESQVEEEVEYFRTRNEVTRTEALERCIDHGDEVGLLGHWAPFAPRVHNVLDARGVPVSGEFVETLREGVPSKGCALDAHRKLHDALERFEVAEPHAVELGLEIGAVGFPF
jgi:hypothetical protein